VCDARQYKNYWVLLLLYYFNVLLYHTNPCHPHWMLLLYDLSVSAMGSEWKVCACSFLLSKWHRSFPI